jgi:hypothetical protein
LDLARAAPSLAAMAAWDDLRLTLARLVDERPEALTRSPNLDGDGETPPYPVGTEDDASVAGGFFAVTVRPWQVMMRGEP